MPQMNKAGHSIQSQGWNPITAVSNKIGNAGSSLSSKAGGFMQVAAAQKMQGAQHEHERLMQGAQHEHEKHQTLVGGAVDIEKTKIAGKSSVDVAKAQGQSHVDATKIAADSRLKEQAAGHRHEQRITVLNQNHELEKAAQAHHNAVHADTAATANRMKETAQNQSHEIALKTLADTHAGNASTRAASFLDALHKHAEGGTQASVSHEGVQASFTFAKPSAPAQETPAVESKPTGPVSVGMPSMPPIKATPAASKAVVGRDAKGRATSLKKAAPSPAKKTTSAAKGALVKRDPKTGQAISLKKK
jgi:hypothetical protein